MKTYSLEEIESQCNVQPQSSLWTVIIPAAGKGTRLGYSKPKILYPISGRTILDRMIDLLEPLCAKFVFVLSPESAPHVTPLLEERLSGRFEAPVIVDSCGMADSIYKAVPNVITPYTLIIWGDQVAISPKTIMTVQRLHQSVPNAQLTLPMVRRENPYVHYAIDDKGLFTHVLEKREGAAMPSVGESDCGVFACDTKRLQEVYADEIGKGIVLSQSTKEWNFLPMLPRFEMGEGSVSAYRLESMEESVGVNDVNDAALLEEYFKRIQII